VEQAIGIGSVSLVMLELWASANDWLLMLLTLQLKLKIKKGHSPSITTVTITVYPKENGNKKSINVLNVIVIFVFLLSVILPNVVVPLFLVLVISCQKHKLSLVWECELETDSVHTSWCPQDNLANHKGSFRHAVRCFSLPRNPYWREVLTTVDLLISIPCFVNKNF